MGDQRHKSSPLPTEEEEDITDEFIGAARGKLADNKRLNKISGAEEEEDAYLIDSQAALAREVTRLVGKDVSEKHISNIIGPVRESSQWDRVFRSTYVTPIAKALRLKETANVAVPLPRVELITWLARLPDERFEDFRAALEEAKLADKKL